MLLLRKSFVEIGECLIEAGGVCIDRDLEPLREFRRELVDLGLGLLHMFLPLENFNISMCPLTHVLASSFATG